MGVQGFAPRRSKVSLSGELLGIGDLIPRAEVLEHHKNGDPGVADVLCVQMLDVLGGNGFNDLLNADLVDGLLYLVLSPEHLVRLFLLFDSVGIFAGRKICGGDCRLCDDSAVEVWLGKDEPVFLLAQHNLEMAVLAAPL